VDMLSMGLTTPEAQMNYILKKAMSGDSAKSNVSVKVDGSSRN